MEQEGMIVMATAILFLRIAPNILLPILYSSPQHSRLGSRKNSGYPKWWQLDEAGKKKLPGTSHGAPASSSQVPQCTIWEPLLFLIALH